MTTRQVKTALISVYDKTGLEKLGRRLAEAGVRILSSGGTAAALSSAGISVELVSDVTGQPEILGGRVKTLHPVIHGGILANRDDPAHMADLDANGIGPIDLVVTNLYPFSETVSEGAPPDLEAVEKIDIGGPTMIRAAAKNFLHVGVVVDPDRYDEVAAAVARGGLDDDLRRDLARAAFFHTASYDAAIVGWLEREAELPDRMVIPLQQVSTLRYGENPHQSAALYADAGPIAWFGGDTPIYDPPVLIRAQQLQGKAMSFNNYADAEAAWRQVNGFGMFTPAAVIVKHANPCGVAVGADITEAFQKAWDCDPLSAFGSVVALNQAVTAETAVAILEAGFVEVVVAPSVDPEAATLLSAKENLRVLTALRPSEVGPDFRRVSGGFLVQARDHIGEGSSGFGEAFGTVVSDREPTREEWADMRFAWSVVGGVKSNAIVIAYDGAAVGIGAGDQSRVGAAQRAIEQADGRGRNGVAASDAFFPFRDGVDALVDAGVTAIIEPGGSRRDDEVIQAADERGVSLVFTGSRHFLH